MSLFNKVFASMGIGGARVDTKLERETLIPGGEVRGVVEIEGGNVIQNIEGIYFALYTKYKKEFNDSTYMDTALIDKFRLTDSFEVAPNEKKAIPFTFTLPIDTPLTIGRTKVWVSTGLDIKNAVDPTDKDYVTIAPNPLMDSVLTSISNLGFRLRETECEQAPYRLRRRLPFIQEFEFIPVSGVYRSRLDELEVVFFPISDNKLEMAVQVDRRAKGLGGFLAEALEMDETHLRLTVTSEDIPMMAQKMNSVLNRYS